MDLEFLNVIHCLVNFLHDLLHYRLHIHRHCPFDRRWNFAIFAYAVDHPSGIYVVVKLPAVSLSMACLQTLLVKFQILKMTHRHEKSESTIENGTLFKMAK